MSHQAERRPPRSIARAFAVPSVLAVSTSAGLLTALLGGPGPWQWGTWIALSAPIALTVYCITRGRLA